MMQRKKRPCLFCIEGKDPYFGQIEVLERFLTERGKIIARKRTGVCSKHQKRLSKAIKQARFLALLPFLKQVS